MAKFDQLLGAARTQKLVFSVFSVIFSCFQTHLHKKSPEMGEKHILTSIWSMQHPNAGQNIQQGDQMVQIEL